MDTTALTATTKPASIQNFASLVELGVSFWESAGVELVRLLDERPRIFDEIIAEYPWATRELLESFEMIGRKKLHPKVLFMPKHVAARLAGLKYEDQIYALNGVPVVKVPRTANRRRWDAKTVVKPVEKLTPHEARLAIGPNGIRTPEQQRVEAGKPYHTAHCLCAVEIQVMNGRVWIKKVNEAPADVPRVALRDFKAVVRLMVDD